MRPIAFSLLILIAACAGFQHDARAAAGETELREKLLFNKKKNNAEGATAMVTVLDESAARVGAMSKNPQGRRLFEMFLRDAQDAIVTMNSPDAQKVFAAALGRIPLDGQVTLCYALRVLPANADVDAAATRLLKPQLDFRFRTALIDLLAEHRCTAAFDKIAACLEPKGLPSVQIATCRALQLLQDKKAIPALIKYMLSFPPGQGGRYIHEATGALRTLTGQSFTANAGDWKKWWEANQQNFAIDGSKSVEPDFNYELSEKQDLEYYEVPVVENRLVIVLDTSGSMNFGGKPSRMDSAKSALKDFIKALPEKTLFNIVAFSTDVKRWRKDVALLPANEANKKDATKFVDEQKANGGTQTALAMEEALREVAVINGCETIYLVTDGNPNPWAQNVTAEMQEKLITWFNQGLKIRINTIGIYTVIPKDEEMMVKAGMKEDVEKMKKFLYDLASNNDGVYREVGKGGGTEVVKFDPKKEKEKKDKDDKVAADKAAKDKAGKEVAGKDGADKDAKDKDKAVAAKDDKEKDAKEKDAITREGVPVPLSIEEKGVRKDPKDDKTPVVPPKSEKDFDIDLKIKPREPKKDPAPAKPEDAKKDDAKKDEPKKPAKPEDE